MLIGWSLSFGFKGLCFDCRISEWVSDFGLIWVSPGSRCSLSLSKFRLSKSSLCQCLTEKESSRQGFELSTNSKHTSSTVEHSRAQSSTVEHGPNIPRERSKHTSRTIETYFEHRRNILRARSKFELSRSRNEFLSNFLLAKLWKDAYSKFIQQICIFIAQLARPAYLLIIYRPIKRWPTHGLKIVEAKFFCSDKIVTQKEKALKQSDETFSHVWNKNRQVLF